MNFTPIQTISLGVFKIQIWGLLVAAGIVAGTILAAKRAKDKKVKIDHILNLVIILIISGFIGARILYLLLNLDFYRFYPGAMFKVWEGGFAIYGGIVLGAISFILYAKIKKLPLRKLIDIFAPAFFLTLSLSRIGCFLVNDHLGKVTEVPWAINFGALPRHPISAYYALSAALISGILLIYERYLKIKPEGILGALGMILYGMFRFLLDFTRDYETAALMARRKKGSDK